MHSHKMYYGKPNYCLCNFAKNLFLISLILATASTIHMEQNNSGDKTWPTFPNPPLLSLVTQIENIKDNVNVQTVEKLARPLVIQCTASFPVYFEFTPPKFSDFKLLNHLNASASQYNETLIIKYDDYMTNVTTLVRGKEKRWGRSGNYTCRSGIDKYISSSIYLHIRESHANTLFDDNLNKTYSEIVDEQFWTIPCPAHIETFSSVDLYRKNGTDESKINYTKYDPKHGFLLDKSKFDRPVGNFECVGTLGDITDSYTLSLNNYNVFPSEDRVSYFNNNTFEVQCESDEKITINVASGILKMVSAKQSKSKSFKYYLNYAFMVEPSLEKSGTNMLQKGVVTCTTTNSSTILHSWQYDIGNLCVCQRKPSGSFDVKIYSGESKSSTRPNFLSCTTIQNTLAGISVIYTDTVTEDQTNTVEKYYNKISPNGRIHYSAPTVGYTISSYSMRNRLSQTLEKDYRTSLISCERDGFKSFIKAVATSSGYEVNPAQINAEANLKLYNTTTNERMAYFVADEVEINCVASRYIFYEGSIQWHLHYKNGTSQSVQGNATEPKINGTNTTPEKWAFVESVIIQLVENLVSVSCSATIWNTTEIVSQTMKLQFQILDGFQGYYERNSTDRCNLTSKSPVILMDRYARFPWSHRSPSASSIDTGRQKLFIVTDLNITLSSVLSYIKLICVSEYPTEWAKIDRGSLLTSASEYINITKSQEKYSPCFQRYITVSASASSSLFSSSIGEYICRKRNDKTLSSSVYIYANGTNYPSLVNEGSHMDVAINNSEPITILPCRVTNPLISVDLYYHEEQGSYRKLEQPDFISYDPRKGFYMMTSNLKISDTFVCVVSNSSSLKTSITFSMKTADTRRFSSALNDDDILLLKATMEKMDNVFNGKNNGSRSREWLQILQTVLLVIIILGMIGLWFALKQYQTRAETTARTLGKYTQLDNSL